MTTEVQNKWATLMNDKIPIHNVEKESKISNNMLEGSYVEYLVSLNCDITES